MTLEKHVASIHRSHPIWHATNGIVGGHALKHLAAAMSRLVIANALNRLSKSGSAARPTSRIAAVPAHI
jgi:hypothetical protein